MDSPRSRSTSQSVAGRDRHAGPATEPGELSITCLTSLAEVDAITPEWVALERDASQPALFQSAAWCRVLVERLLAGRDRHRPWIVALRQRDRLVGLAPLSLTRIGPVRLASALGEPLAQYGDILVSPDAPWAADALIDRLRSGRRSITFACDASAATPPSQRRSMAVGPIPSTPTWRGIAISAVIVMSKP